MADLKGLKRICMSCGARFYDLNKKPIICPSCSVEFTGEIKVKARRGRLPADAAVEADDEDVAVIETEELETEDGVEVVSLDDLEDDKDADEDEDGLIIEEDDVDVDLDDEDLDDLDDDDIDEDIAEDDDDK